MPMAAYTCSQAWSWRPGLVLARRQRSQVPLASSCLGVLSPGLLLGPTLSSKACSLLALSPRRVLELGHRAASLLIRGAIASAAEAPR